MDKKIGEAWLDFFGGNVPKVPPITYLMKCARDEKLNGNIERAENYESLIYLLHNSVVSPYSDIHDSVKFGYGGIGVVIHKNCTIKEGVAIGQNVTLGGSSGSSDYFEGRHIHVPVVKENCYIAAGAKVVGGLVIGEYSIVAANSVVNRSVEPFSIVGGQPAKLIKKLTKDNCLRYRGFYSHIKSLSNDEFLSIFPSS